MGFAADCLSLRRTCVPCWLFLFAIFFFFKTIVLVFFPPSQSSLCIAAIVQSQNLLLCCPHFGLRRLATPNGPCEKGRNRNKSPSEHIYTNIHSSLLVSYQFHYDTMEGVFGHHSCCFMDHTMSC